MRMRFPFPAVVFLGILLTVFVISCGDSSTGPEEESYSISGRIVDSTGTGIPGVSVSVSGTTVSTDSDGYFTIQGIESGTYTITYSKDGYSFISYSNQVTIGDSSLELEAVSGSAMNTNGTYTISGLILRSDNELIAGVQVQLTGDNVSESTVTDSTGAYSFSGLSNGEYTLTPTKDYFSFPSVSLQVEIENTNLTVQTIRMYPLMYTVSGKILDENGNGVFGVEVAVIGGGKEQTVTSNDYGAYFFDGAHETTYTLTYEKENYTFTPSTMTIYFTGVASMPGEVIATGPGGHSLSDEITFVTINKVTDPYHMMLEFYITLSGYEMSETMVTNTQYANYLTEALAAGEITATTKSITGAAGEWSGEEYMDLEDSDCEISYSDGSFIIETGTERHPVVQVTWYGAKAFAKYYNLDLPTEAEWQYAASGGLNYQYGTSDGTLDTSKANYDSNVKHATDVGSYPANPFGLYDMAGNVWEWCHDWHGIFPSGTYDNYTGLESGTNRILRGGSWDFKATGCAVEYRSGTYPNIGRHYVGFRVVRRSSGLFY